MTTYHDLPTEVLVAGEDLSLVVQVIDDDGAVSISGASTSYEVVAAKGADSATAHIDDGDPDVDVSVTSAADGEVTVTLDQGATDALGGDRYWHRLEVDDIGTGLQVWHGHLRIEHK